MGVVFVTADVRREGDPSQTVEFLVDSGATYSVLSDCRFNYQGIDAPSPVVLGERNDVALLGTVTLEIMGLVRPMRPMLAGVG